MRRKASQALCAISFTVLWLFGAAGAAAQELNGNCTISVLNRNVRVRPDGSWVLPNIPANFGPVRARVTCIVDGQTVSGESEPFLIPANGVVNRPNITFGQTTAIPRSVTVTSSVATLTELNATAQLTVTARYADGSTKDVTSGNGTQYTVSNAAIATVSGSGLVRAVKGGTVVIQATLEGASGMTSVRVAPAGVDSDNDGIPDEYEVAKGLNPTNAIDAQEDPDHDGLTTLQEYQLGTEPLVADTDSDRLLDGQEIARGTNPLLWDTDGDGISDGLEAQSGSDPLDAASMNLAAVLTALRVTPAHFAVTYNTVVGEASQQLTVTGDLLDGRTINLTSTARGTNYASSSLAVCSFGGTDGRIFAGLGGGCIITVTNAGVTAQATGDITNFAPTALGSISIPGYANNVDVNGTNAFVAAGGAGLVVIDASTPSTPRIIGSLDTPGNANDVRVVGNVAYVAAGSAGLQIIDVTDPAAPQLRGTFDTPGEANDVIVAGSLAFVADGNAGLQIIDVSNPAAPLLVKSVPLAGTARGVDVSGGIAVVATDSPSAGLRVVNISSPAAAAVVGSTAISGEPIDVSLGTGYAYVAAYTGGMSVVDVRTPTAPKVVGGLPGSSPNGFVPRDVQAAGQFAIFSEQLFANAVAPIVDVSTPATPRFRGVLDFGQDYAGTGIAVSGPYVYWTGQSFVVSSENGVSGTTRLFIGQYLALEDRNGVAPTVTITSPDDGTTVIQGLPVTVRATATDDVAVSSVSFTVNGQVVLVDTSQPYEHTFTVPDTGTVLLGAMAADLGGNVTNAQTVTVSVIPDPLTTVVGRVVDRDLQPVAGVTVNALGHTATTGADGTFSINGVPTLQNVLAVSAALTANNVTVTGTSTSVPPVRGGTTDVGDIIVTATAFEADLGTLVPRCDYCNTNIDLPFAFPISGTTYTRIIANNGYLFTTGGDYIEAFCCDLTVTDAGLTPDPAAGFYVNTSVPGRAVFTWYKQFTYDSGPILNTVQIILFADGKMQLGYQGVARETYAEVGLFPAARTKSTIVDFSATSSLTVADREAVYEEFDPTHPVDIDGGFIVLTPSTGGGYEMRTVPDTSAPTCVVVNPVDGATLFEAEALSIQVSAFDNSSIGHVAFTSSDGSLDQNVTTAPYSVPFVVPVGVSQITFNATVFDGWGNSSACTSTVSVVEGPPPSVLITSHAAGATVSEGATTTIAVDAANRVPVTSVDLTVNGAAIATDTAAPFEFLFAVPAGVTPLSVNVVATNSVGKTTAASVSLNVVSDPLTTVQGRVVDRTLTAVNAADVTLDVHGVTAEVFNFDTPLTELPDLAGLTANRVATVSSLNLRNPNGVFGDNPFGFGTSVSHAIRYTATLRTPGTNTYTFTLGVNGGGRLVVNGTTVVDIPTATGAFQQASGTVTTVSGSIPIEILTFDGGNPEVQLLYAESGGGGEALLMAAAADAPVPQAIPTSALTPTQGIYSATTQTDGTFSVANVRTTLGTITARATGIVSGKTARGRSAVTTPVPAGTTDLGTIRLADFSALYAAAFTGPTGLATLYQIDPATAQATLVGPIGFWRVSAMDVTEDGIIYGVGRNPADGKNVLLTIDPATGAGTQIGPTGVENLGYGDTIADISFRQSDGALFGYLEAGDGLGMIDLTTGAARAIGRSFVSCCGNGLAFAPDGRLLHINEDELHVLDQTTGRATIIVPMRYPAIPGGPRISSMDFRPDTGELFGTMRGNGGTSYLTKIDIATGVVTIIGARTVDGLDALTWGPQR
jgi:hypothetical protein